MENVTVSRKEGGDLRERRDTEKRYDTVNFGMRMEFCIYIYKTKRKNKKEKEEKETTNNVLSLSLIATYHVSAVAS